jgi:hypothetical protein
MRWRGERGGSTSARGALGGRGSLVGAHSTGRAPAHSMHCPGIGRCVSQIDRGRRMTVNAAFRSCAR